MPYKDKQKQREYQNRSNKERRRQWIEASGPCKNCGSSEDLEVDHKDPAQKISHTIWSWSREKRDAELSKCQVLCKICHKEKSNSELRLPESIRHGRYSNWRRGCRCDQCVTAQREYKRMYRANGGVH